MYLYALRHGRHRPDDKDEDRTERLIAELMAVRETLADAVRRASKARASVPGIAVSRTSPPPNAPPSRSK